MLPKIVEMSIYEHLREGKTYLRLLIYATCNYVLNDYIWNKERETNRVRVQSEPNPAHYDYKKKGPRPWPPAPDKFFAEDSQIFSATIA